MKKIDNKANYLMIIEILGRISHSVALFSLLLAIVIDIAAYIYLGAMDGHSLARSHDRLLFSQFSGYWRIFGAAMIICIMISYIFWFIAVFDCLVRLFRRKMRKTLSIILVLLLIPAMWFFYRDILKEKIFNGFTIPIEYEI